MTPKNLSKTKALNLESHNINSIKSKDSNNNNKETNNNNNEENNNNYDKKSKTRRSDIGLINGLDKNIKFLEPYNFSNNKKKSMVSYFSTRNLKTNNDISDGIMMRSNNNRFRVNNSLDPFSSGLLGSKQEDGNRRRTIKRANVLFLKDTNKYSKKIGALLKRRKDFSSNH